MNRLTITEYNNMGDLSPGAPQEPPIKRQDVRANCASEVMTNNTRLLCLWSTFGGEFATFDEPSWNKGDPIPESAVWVPIQPQYEITRIVHMNASVRIAFRDGDYST